MATGKGKLVGGPDPDGELRKHLAIGVVASLFVGPAVGGGVAAYMEGGRPGDANKMGLLTGLVSSLVVVGTTVPFLFLTDAMSDLGVAVGISVFMTLALVFFSWIGARTGRWLRYNAV